MPIQPILAAVAVLVLIFGTACLRRSVANPNGLVVAVASAPNNLDPRVALDAVSLSADQLIFNGLTTFDEQLRVVPDLAEPLENPEPTVYVVSLRRGVRFMTATSSHRPMSSTPFGAGSTRRSSPRTRARFAC